MMVMEFSNLAKMRLDRRMRSSFARRTILTIRRILRFALLPVASVMSS